MKHAIKMTSLALSLLATGQVFANDARSYSLMPQDTQLLETRVSYTDSSTPGIINTQTDNQTELLKYTKYFNLADHLSAVYFIAPYVDVRQTNRSTFKSSGVSDLTVLFAMGIYNSPALDKKTYSTYNKNGVTSACALGVSLPTGSYDSKSPLNISGNRYAAKGECQVGLRDNRIMYEITGGLTGYSENDSYAGNNKLKQDKLYHVETHVSYTVLPTMWASFDSFYFNGGNIKLNSNYLNKSQNSVLLGASMGYLLTPKHFIKLSYQQTVKASNTTTSQKSAAASYTYIF